MKGSILWVALCTVISTPIWADAVQPTAVIDCDYKISPQIKTIEKPIILSWSEKASLQAFQFNPATMEAQLEKLKTCFTEQGWAGFQAAMEKSGNLKVIKAQKLIVTSQLDGPSEITEAKDNQWKVLVPLQVIYQNDKEKVNQILRINLTITRKVNGELGIAQIVAAPSTVTTLNPSKESSTPIAK